MLAGSVDRRGLKDDETVEPAPVPTIAGFEPPSTYTRADYLSFWRSGRAIAWRWATVYHRTGLYLALAGTRGRAWDLACGVQDFDAMRCLDALAPDEIDAAAEREAAAAARAEHERRQRRDAAGEITGGRWDPPRRTVDRLRRAGKRAARIAALAAAEADERARASGARMRAKIATWKAAREREAAG